MYNGIAELKSGWILFAATRLQQSRLLPYRLVPEGLSKKLPERLRNCHLKRVLADKRAVADKRLVNNFSDHPIVDVNELRNVFCASIRVRNGHVVAYIIEAAVEDL